MRTKKLPVFLEIMKSSFFIISLILIIYTIGQLITFWIFTDEYEKDLLEAKYKEIRHIVQDGKFYRLQGNLVDNDYHIFEYVNKDEALLFVFLPQSKVGHRFTTIKLRGLDENKDYKFNLFGQDIVKSGRYLMNHGLTVKLEGDYASLVLYIKEV